MFWGVKLTGKQDYSCIVDHSFAITHAVAEVATEHVEVHAKINNDDIILCHLNPAEGLLQESLDLRISEGEAISLYLKTNSEVLHYLTSTAVHLSGYLLDEPIDDQWENEFTEDEEEEEEETGELYQPPPSFHDIVPYVFNNYPSALDSDSSDEDYCYESDEDDGEEYRYVINPNDIRTQLPEIQELDDDKDTYEEEDEMTSEENDEEEQGEELEAADEEDADSSGEEEEDKPAKSTTRKRSREQLSDEGVTSGSVPGKKSKKAHAVKMDIDATQPGDSSFTSSSTSEPTKKKASSKNKVTITDVEVGTGKLAKPGKKVYIQFKGRLAHNNKVFDCSEKGKPFHFHLGRGEVIKGWETGIKGMRVGGKRHLLIPASKGYGAEGLPPNVPPHSDITFSIKLVNVK